MKKFFKRFLILTTIVTAILWIANKVIFFLALVKELLPTSNGRFYHWRHGKIFYKKQGSGSPLLLIHDLQTDSSSYEWSKVEKELAKNHTVYTLDLLGCGRSHKPTITYTNYLYVQLVESFLKNIVNEPVQIAVTGASCSFVLFAAYQNSDMITNIIMINPTSFTKQAKFPTIKSKIFKMLISLPVFGTSIYNYFVSLQKICKKFNDEYFYNKELCSLNDIHAYYEAAHIKGAFSKHLYASIVSGYVNMPVSHILSKLTIPITIIGGEKQEEIISVINEYKEQLPNIQIGIVSETKKLPQLEKPEEVVEIICSTLTV